MYALTAADPKIPKIAKDKIPGLIEDVGVTFPKLGKNLKAYQDFRLSLESRTAEREEERGSLVDFSLCPDIPAMPAYDVLNDRQTDSGTFKLLLVVKPLEHPE